MGVHSVSHHRKEQGRDTIMLTNVSGDAGDRMITIGKVGVGEREQSFTGVTALIESCPAGASLELWLPRVAAGDEAASARDPLTDYYFAGVSVFPARTAATPTGITASFGMGNWLLSGYPGAQLRARGGGSAGPVVVSWSAY